MQLDSKLAKIAFYCFLKLKIGPVWSGGWADTKHSDAHTTRGQSHPRKTTRDLSPDSGSSATHDGEGTGLPKTVALAQAKAPQISSVMLDQPVSGE